MFDVESMLPRLSNDVLLPEQFGPSGQLSAEQLLWGAVLIDAIEVVRGETRGAEPHDGHSRNRREAFDWIRTIEHRIGGFDWICDRFGWEPAWVRKGIGLEFGELLDGKFCEEIVVTTREKIIEAINRLEKKDFTTKELMDSAPALEGLSLELVVWHLKQLVESRTLVRTRFPKPGGLPAKFAKRTGPVVAETSSCAACGEVKPRTSFYERSNGRPQAYCKACQKKNQRRTLETAPQKQSVSCPVCGGELDILIQPRRKSNEETAA